MSRSLTNRSLVFIATQTTGWDEDQHEIIEIAMIDGGGSTLLHTAVAPERIETAQPSALEEARYNEGEWAPSPLFSGIAQSVLRCLSGSVVVGYDTQVDMRFVLTMLGKRFSEETLQLVSPHRIDIVTLAWEHLVSCGLESLRLEDICSFLRIPFSSESPSALFRAREIRGVYEKLLRATFFQRWWWRRRSNETS